MIEDVCPATPPYRHLAALFSAVEDEDWQADQVNYWAIGEAFRKLKECPACLAAIGGTVEE